MKIALTGRAGSGKDYFGEVLKEFGYKRFSFSDQLKKLAHCIYPWMEKDYLPEEKEQKFIYETSIGEKIEIVPREVWLKLNFLRDIEDGIFVRMLNDEIENYYRELQKEYEFGHIPDEKEIFISDLRTPIEYDYVKKNGFKIIKIISEKSIHKKHSFEDTIDTFDVDYVFHNDFSGKEKIQKFIKEILDENKAC